MNTTSSAFEGRNSFDSFIVDIGITDETWIEANLKADSSFQSNDTKNGMGYNTQKEQIQMKRLKKH